MAHILSLKNVEDFTHEHRLASTSEGKRLLIQSFINASGELVSYFIVTKRNHGNVYVEQSRHLLINAAIEAYNKINL